MIKNILLIDDDEEEIFIFNEALQEINSSSSCTFVTDADEGIKVMNNLAPDIIFLDINMPKTNGFECLSNIKKAETDRHIPVILYSTGIDETVTEKALAMGAAACVKKTYSIEALADILKKILLGDSTYAEAFSF